MWKNSSQTNTFNKADYANVKKKTSTNTHFFFFFVCVITIICENTISLFPPGTRLKCERFLQMLPSADLLSNSNSKITRKKRHLIFSFLTIQPSAPPNFSFALGWLVFLILDRDKLDFNARKSCSYFFLNSGYQDISWKETLDLHILYSYVIELHKRVMFITMIAPWLDLMYCMSEPNLKINVVLKLVQGQAVSYTSANLNFSKLLQHLSLLSLIYHLSDVLPSLRPCSATDKIYYCKLVQYAKALQAFLGLHINPKSSLRKTLHNFVTFHNLIHMICGRSLPLSIVKVLTFQ